MTSKLKPILRNSGRFALSSDFIDHNNAYDLFASKTFVYPFVFFLGVNKSISVNGRNTDSHSKFGDR